MTDLDILGFRRSERQHTWGCSGRVVPAPDLDPEDAQDVHPRSFVLERRHHRWGVFSERTLLAVGDNRRDLAPRGGGLVRLPAGHGFAALDGASLLRQVGPFDRAAVVRWARVGTASSWRAAREAVDVRLRHESGAEIVLGVDAQTGIWTYLDTPGYTVHVDHLSQRGDPVPALDLLNMIPDVDLSSGRLPASDALAPVLAAVQEASGLQAEVLQQDEESETFRLVLLDGEQPVGLVSRQHAELVQEEPVFGGRQGWVSGDDWTLHVDSSQEDPRWVDTILRLIRTA